MFALVLFLTLFFLLRNFNSSRVFNIKGVVLSRNEKFVISNVVSEIRFINILQFLSTGGTSTGAPGLIII